MSDASVEAGQAGPNIETVARGTAGMEAVLTLYRCHRQTLGFFPTGAFEQCASERRLHLARLNGVAAGYVAYRVSRGEAVIAHLCVAEGFRSRGVARALLDQVFRDTSQLLGVRLSCRRDYEEANRMWPRFGFTCVGERRGRGHDGMALLDWRRANGDDLPLFRSVHDDQRLNRRNVVVDANVFFDFDSEEERAAESKSLLADWLEAEILLCVTPELWNEIARRADEETRSRRRTQLTHYFMHTVPPSDLEVALQGIVDLLPPAVDPSDESDRRQLAHAVAARAEFFLTRDSDLLDHADAIRQAFAIRVLRPADLVRVIHNDIDPGAYAPARVAGTEIEQRAPGSERELLVFQAFGQAETRASFLSRCRRVMAEPDRYRTVVVTAPGSEPILLHSSEIVGHSGETHISLLRVLSHPLGPTLLRRALSDIVLSNQQQGIARVRCDDLIDPRVRGVLTELGFRESPSGFVKTSLNGVRSRTSLASLLPDVGPEASDHDIERQFWPVKIEDTEIRSFVIPIRPHWAADLFDAGLADGGLFRADRSRALALENVYYSASPIQIPTGARILWYVSSGVEAIRASSLCLETVRVPAREAYRRFQRLGIYERRHVLDLTDGDPNALVTAYRFAFTERLRSPISWDRFQGLLEQHQGHGNPIAGPVCIPNSVFVALYREATLAPRS
jgi:ribosomal protein S18 acetylase RimI-like enzyme/predicted nucleic acid-binding protein